jgi:hypothetical protein
LTNYKPKILSPGEPENGKPSKFSSSGGKPETYRKNSSRGGQIQPQKPKVQQPTKRPDSRGSAKSQLDEDKIYKRRMEMLQMVDDEEDNIMINHGKQLNYVIFYR